MTAYVRSSGTRAPRVLRWVVGVAAVWGLAGPAAGLGWIVVAGWHLVRTPAPRRLLAVSATLFALVPVLWVAGNGDRLGEFSVDLVLANRAPGTAAALALALLVTGVWRDVVGAAGTDLPSAGRPTIEEEAW